MEVQARTVSPLFRVEMFPPGQEKFDFICLKNSLPKIVE